jgi:hypothetical protein
MRQLSTLEPQGSFIFIMLKAPCCTTKHVSQQVVKIYGYTPGTAINTSSNEKIKETQCIATTF